LQIDSEKKHAWLQLIRPPNLVTVIGDPLAGAALAFAAGVNGHIIAAIAVAIVSLLLYMSGLIMNDYADIEEDKRERPKRPLPSGIISPRHAIIIALVLAFIGTGIAFLINPITGITAILLIITIALYNFTLKEEKFIGSIIMGLCRGLSFLLGAFAVGYKIGIHNSTIIYIALILIFYIAAVTSIATNETEEIYIGTKRWFPTVAISLLLIILKPFAGPFNWLSLFPGITAVIISIKIAKQLSDEPEPMVVQKSIGLYIRILLLLQAAICFALVPYGIIAGSLLIALWPLGNKLAKRFYGS
jgi:4-hydroxybenzoate polyprenyltransferase